MEAVFIKLVNMSISASYMVIIIALLRLMFKKSPKWIWSILWAMVAIRLLIPFSMESVLSLMPTGEPVSPEIFQVSAPVLPADRPVVDPIPKGTSPVWPGEVKKPSMTPVTKPVTVPEQPVEESTEVSIGWIAAVVWAVGLSGMLMYALISYLRVRHKVREGVPLKENCYLCDHIGTPFILGIVRPRIYLPSDMDVGDHDYVIAHEMAHLKRKDHWWKPFGFFLLSVYWFNPVIWLGYILLCRDIELACDERVIKELGSEQKKPYADALINCSASRRFISACPLAFGEGNVERRIKSVLNYKKPAFWVILLSIVICIAVAVTMLTDPITEKEGEMTNQEDASVQKEDEERILFELVNEIANNPDAAMHSNPYRYIEMKQDAYDEILDYGDTAVEYFVAYLREADNYGLQAYIMAAACSEITGIGQKTNGSGWATAGEWLAIYESVLSVPDNQTSNSTEKFITVDGVDISIDEINSQIKSTFNKDLFYGGFYSDSEDITLNAELILNKTLEYDLYYNPDRYTQITPKIYIVITNLTHHQSTAEKPLLYMFGIDVTKHGLRSDFSRMGAVSKSCAIELDNPFSLYMGSYSMCINEITQPTHEKMSDEWKRKAESAIQLYMDDSVTHAIDENDLAPGKYTVYIEGFSKSDSDSTVVFVHEDGRVYMAEYLFLHEIADGEPADINRLYLVEWAEKETFQMYLSRLRVNPALKMEYRVDAVDGEIFSPGEKKSLIDTFTVEKNGKQYTYRVYRIKTDSSVEDYVVSEDGKEILELGAISGNDIFFISPFRVLDEIEYDIDGDGVKERGVLNSIGTSGVFAFKISFWEGNKLEYFTGSTSIYYDIRFHISEDGSLEMLAVDHWNSETHVYDIYLLSGHIVMNEKDGVQDTRYLVESSAENQISIEIPLFENGGAINQTILEYPMQWLYECTGQTFDYSVREYGLNGMDEYAAYCVIVKHRITYSSDDLISIVFEGDSNQKTAAHPVRFFFPLNINRKTGERIRLKDIYTVDEAFYDVFLKYAREQVPQELSQLISVEELFRKDWFLSGMDTADYWAYFTDTGVGISCPVPHVAGDHMEIEIPYSALQ